MIQALISDLSGYNFLFRWLHVFAGLIWIGMLYYFNFVQGAFMAETQEAVAKSQVTQKLLPRALWWFRMGALWTFIFGALMLSKRAHIELANGGTLASSYWINILTGSFMGTLMFLNVWLIIWPKQKIIIANAVAVAGGAAANPAAALGAARASVASRTNTLFSIPMLFFMLGANHLIYQVNADSNVVVYWLVASLIILGVEANAILGKNGPMTTIKGVISCGFALTAVFVAVISVLI
jgi:uncharacterized membrane protein